MYDVAKGANHSMVNDTINNNFETRKPAVIGTAGIPASGI